MGKQHARKTPAICPVCGEDVPRGALACPECGADHNSGWREGAETYDGLDLPEDFDYHDFAQREFGRSPKPSGGMSAIWWITAIVLLVLTILYFLVGG